MCHRCDYAALLGDAGLDPTANRLGVMAVVGDNSYPLSAADIYHTLERSGPINRVTVYRILDLLVAHGLLDRISTGGRAFYYGMAPNRHHAPHPHFYCTRCGRMDCLTPDSLNVDAASLRRTFPGRIDKVEVRIDGICTNCMK